MHNASIKLAMIPAIFFATVMTQPIQADTTAGIGFASNDVSRGISQSGDNPSFFGSIDYINSDNGLMAGFKGHTLGGMNPYLQFDVYAGITKSLSENSSFDVGVLSYQWPDAEKYPAGDPRNIPAHGEEIFAIARYGLFDATIYHFINTPLMKNSNYFSVGVTKHFENGVALGASVGRNNYANPEITNQDFTSVQANASWKGFNLVLSKINRDFAPLNLDKDTKVVLSWEKRFNF